MQIDAPTVSETAPPEAAWAPADAVGLYHMGAWGEGYFGVNDAGHVVCRPDPRREGEIDLAAVVDEVVAGGLRLPAVVRFQDLLDTRVRQLNEAFQAAIAEAGYGGAYTGVYPVKVNQLREVVDEIVEAGRPYGFGLECGSKTELVATLPRLESDDTLCLVNGYKDAAMLGLILTFQRLGRRVLPIVEKTAELDQFLALAEAAGQPARFGLRVKLSAVAPGPWTKSGGTLSKFGVSLPEVVDVADRLLATGRADALRLLHFHVGSQIGDVGALKTAVREITRVYAHLTKRGLEIPYLDVGGGLGVNYEALPLGAGRGGVDYSMQEYANAIVYAVGEVCEAEGVAPPHLVSENGRAVTAHHSVLVVDALEQTEKPGVADDFALPADAHPVVRDLDALRASAGGAVGLGELLEVVHDATEAREKAEALFQYGYLDIGPMALAERLYWTVCRAVHARVEAADPDWTPPELEALGDALADQVLCDFSVFQSLMDHWALGQRFPIVPIARLDERPTRRARLVDITCDSDGEVARFVSPEGDKHALEVHDIGGEGGAGRPYRLGVFLVGAYQDILGDAHNLFGGVAEAHVYLDETEPSGYYVEETLPGTTVEQMLARVQYFPSELQTRVQALLREKTKGGVVRPKQAQAILADYRALFDASTYLDASDG
ncbi:biosynthetic arginine decarboxylase [Rubrivirga sp. S365]|uniref:biosynthetic arginine decarboxylase n=1 Tax=Rubrivirga sp. S365 TaxID=3076080 RepID=UPI0028C8A9BE|nr:biosynthetic arginine decarboxylase [Rubrivirga sp. S365]MDT7856593.1 biosynthetic arginine decarboxylase [Rubrivirga sp. S365]